MAPLLSRPPVAVPFPGPLWLLEDTRTSLRLQPEPPWAPTKQPVQLNTGTGAATGGALYAGLWPRSAALAEPAATRAPVATEPSRIFFIASPRSEVGCTAGCWRQARRGCNCEFGCPGRFWRRVVRLQQVRGAR